jgi:Mn-dependent transcriptional regulator
MGECADMRDFQKLSKSMEDYLEVMYHLKTDKGIIKVIDIAKELDVKPPSVFEVVKRLSKMNLASHEKYGEIMLSEEGIKIANDIIYKHITLKNFLNILNVDSVTAEKEACAMEHILSNSTINKLKRFTEFIGMHKDEGHFTKSFGYYQKHNKLPNKLRCKHFFSD